MTIFLVRHGRPLVRRGIAAADWELDPAGFDDVWALRSQLPSGARWFCSPEPKARETAALLTDGEVGVVEALMEQRRDGTWLKDFDTVLRRAFADSEVPALPGWEPLARTTERVVAATDALRADGDLVLVGHATAWTVLEAALTGRVATIEDWASWRMPDVHQVVC